MLHASTLHRIDPNYLRTLSNTLLGLCLLLLTLPSTAQAATQTEATELWQALRSGEGIALIRHALAPGGGDPDNFVLDDCSTQRNLSTTGRTQSRHIGELFSDQQLTPMRLHSSQWCRCLETATLMAVGEVTPNPLLNSFFANRAAGPGQLIKLRQWLMQQPISNEPLVLITHQVVITGLTGVFPASGEIVVILPPTTVDSAITVLGTLKTLK